MCTHIMLLYTIIAPPLPARHIQMCLKCTPSNVLIYKKNWKCTGWAQIMCNSTTETIACGWMNLRKYTFFKVHVIFPENSLIYCIIFLSKSRFYNHIDHHNTQTTAVLWFQFNSNVRRSLCQVSCGVNVLPYITPHSRRSRGVPPSQWVSPLEVPWQQEASIRSSSQEQIVFLYHPFDTPILREHRPLPTLSFVE